MPQIYLPQPALAHPLRYTRYVGPHCHSQGLQLHTGISATLLAHPELEEGPSGVSEPISSALKVFSC